MSQTQIPEKFVKALEKFKYLFSYDQQFVKFGNFWFSKEYIFYIKFLYRYNETQRLLLIASFKDLDLKVYMVKLKEKKGKIYLIVSHNKKPIHTEVLLDGE